MLSIWNGQTASVVVFLFAANCHLQATVLSENEQQVLRVLQNAKVRDVESFHPYLKGLHDGYYRSLDALKGATSNGLTQAGLPPALVDAILEWQRGELVTEPMNAPGPCIMGPAQKLSDSMQGRSIRWVCREGIIFLYISAAFSNLHSTCCYHACTFVCTLC
jgi:hypothetical protein